MIVVIGILAAITVVAYNGIQNRANDSAVQSDLRSIAQRMAIYKLEGATGVYPTTLTLLNGMQLKMTRSAYATVPQQTMNVTYCKNADASEYMFFVYSKSGKLYKVDHTNQVQSIPPSTTISNCGGAAGFNRTGTDFVNIDAGYYDGDWRPWANH